MPKDINNSSPKRILISGITGFLGTNLLAHSSFLRERAIPVAREDFRIVSDFPDAEVALHLAGLAHQSYSASDGDLYLKSNVDLSLDFMQKSSEKGVRHFIFVSTAKVFGEGSEEAYTENSVLQPQDIYAKSKALAEEKLTELASKLGLQLSILRPPLIYGPNSKANFRSLWNAIAKGYPIPVSTRKNQRSILSTYNFADFLETLLGENSKNQPNHHQVYLLQDPHSVSTKELVISIAKAQNLQPKILSIPHSLGFWGTKMIGKSLAWQKWTGSFYYNNYVTKEILSWEPRFSTSKSLALVFKN